MKKLSKKTNYILNLIRIVSATLVGIIMMPYVNRILGVSIIGKVEYAYTIMNYFLMFSAMGIPIYGIREIAKVRNNIVKRSKLVVELFIILTITTIFSYLALYFLLYYFYSFSDYKEIILIFSSIILLTNIGSEWYFQGMENQVYITIRYAVIRTIVLILLFVLVKSESDINLYCFLLVLNFAGSNIFNLIFIFRSISLKTIRFSTIDIKQHFGPILKIFVATISINIYVQLDNFLIGLIAGDDYLAYYTIPNKLIRYTISFITIVGIVMLPEVSRLWEDNKTKYYMNIKLALELILLLSIPFVGYFFVFSPSIIHLMAGEQFYGSIDTMKILSPLCVIVGLAYFFGYLMLYIQKKESIYITAVIISALMSVVLNIFMIKYLKHIGAAITQIGVEFLAVGFMVYKLKDQISKLNISFLELGKIMVATIVSCIFSKFVSNLFERNFFQFFILSMIYLLLYIVTLILLKEKNISAYLLKKNIG